MIHKTLLVSAFVSLALALTACPGSTPAPVVSSVVVTAPASNALKINAATAFTAVAKDSSGVEITGKTFTWVSSDPNVASVDASGMVTAKRFGDVKITASTDGVNGDSSSQKTFGLEATGGTACDGNDKPNKGTAFFARFREPDGSMPSGNGTLKITGPTGWNGDKAFEFPYDGYTGFALGRWWDGIPIVSGTFTTEMTVNGEKFNSSYQIDATDRIAASTSLTLSNVSPTSITGTWVPVVGGKYLFRLWNNTDGGDPFNTWYWTNNTTATVIGSALNPTKSYVAYITVFSVATPGGNNSPAFTDPLPKQFNVAWRNTAIIL